jgi:hypothetical protein
MKIKFFIFTSLVSLFIGTANAGPWISIKYIHDKIYEMTNYMLPMNQDANPDAGANMKYLLTAMDKVNAYAGESTSYGSGIYATLKAVDDVVVEWAIAKYILSCRSMSFTELRAGESNNVLSKVVNNIFIIITDAGHNGWSLIGSTNITKLQKITLSPTDVLGYGDLAYCDGLYVGVGARNDYAAYATEFANYDAVSSPGGWQTVQVDSGGGRARSIACGDGAFIANWGDTADKALRTTDGQTWTQVSLPEDSYWRLVVHGNGTFVIVSSDGQTAYSTDGGNTFVSGQNLGSGEWLHGVFDSGRFLVLSADGRIMTSINGTSWSLLSDILDTNSSVLSIWCESPRFTRIAAEGQFLAALYVCAPGHYPFNGIYFSYDDSNWHLQEVNKDYFRGLSIGNGYIFSGGNTRHYHYTRIPEHACEPAIKSLGK